MSIIEPPNPDDEDLFDFFEAQVDDEVELDELALPTKSIPDLIALRTRVQMELSQLGETIRAKTDRGRELHSLSFAITYQLQERGEGRG